MVRCRILRLGSSWYSALPRNYAVTVVEHTPLQTVAEFLGTKDIQRLERIWLGVWSMGACSSNVVVSTMYCVRAAVQRTGVTNQPRNVHPCQIETCGNRDPRPSSAYDSTLTTEHLVEFRIGRSVYIELLIGRNRAIQ